MEKLATENLFLLEFPGGRREDGREMRLRHPARRTLRLLPVLGQRPVGRVRGGLQSWAQVRPRGQHQERQVLSVFYDAGAGAEGGGAVRRDGQRLQEDAAGLAPGEDLHRHRPHLHSEPLRRAHPERGDADGAGALCQNPERRLHTVGHHREQGRQDQRLHQDVLLREVNSDAVPGSWFIFNYSSTDPT
jgi:hypothetical protein